MTLQKLKGSTLFAGLSVDDAMFNIAAVKKQSGKRKITGLPGDDVFSPFDRPLPYYSVVPEQRWSDKAFLQLTRQERGDFCMLVDFLWQGCGTMRRSDIPHFANSLSMTEKELFFLVEKLLRVGLLVDIEERLIQPELREQYRGTISTNNNRKRLSKEDGGWGDETP